ncbi:hypothetical protein OS493_013416 [Desmophyllum pertusum]|uniref:Uncharacterized protein n=1 Tax=Desmophyllum pertusum TaxID=174260 RepID=A0A9W9YGS4_9CNID|nr:hypothetical protein OS493_013416 [Desmophyllum pertusum]
MTASYTLTVMASDQGNPSMKSKQEFHITVQDKNDNPPKFDAQVFRGSVKENIAAVSNVVQVTASDEDIGSNAMINYQITAGNSPSYFAIDSSTGIINTTTALDYEKTPSFQLTVSASDSKFTSSVSVIIDVINENDNNPSFEQTNYLASVPENSAVLTSVITVTALDVDPFGQLTYSIEGNHSDAFSVDFTSGLITTADVLDREMIDSYVITVKATDGGEPPLFGVATVTINVNDTNDNPPAFNGSSFTAVISEASDISSFVTKITASDADSGSNAKISYSITAGNDLSDFVIAADTGIISTNRRLDRENISNYALTCMAIDHGQPQLRSMSIIVHVTVSDENDNSPIFGQSVYVVNVTEDVTSGTVVEEVLAVDTDAGLNGIVSYRITAGNDDDTFDIGNGTGVVTVSGVVDRERRDSYSLTVTASDLGNPPNSSSVQLLITVMDVNDNRPLLNSSSLQGGILENSPAGSDVMRIIATDADIGMNAQLVFNFTTTEYSDVFDLNSTSGEITAKKSLDREKQDRYTLKIRVSDHGDPQLSSSADVTITVIDVDDNCPKFEPTVYNMTISENLPFNQSIVQVTATDVDVKDAEKMKYAIWTGNQAGAFTIDKHGFVRVSSGGVDREVTDTFRLVVRAGPQDCGVNNTDGDGNQAEGGSEDKLAATAIVNIIVNDENDNAPRFTRSSYEFQLDSLNDTDIGRVAAIDDDLGSGGIVKFRLLGQTEIEKKWKVTVQAYDLGTPSLNSSIDVIIKTTSITCEAMVFKVSEDGMIKADTLCIFVDFPSGAERLVGDEHQLDCSAKGNTQPQYRWMKDGRFVSNWNDHGDYVIEHVTEEDQGGYSCLAFKFSWFDTV